MKVCVQIRQNEKGEYVAVCPHLPGCLSRGRTSREAIRKVDEAIRGYLAAAGEFVPERVVEEVEEVEKP